MLRNDDFHYEQIPKLHRWASRSIHTLVSIISMEELHLREPSSYYKKCWEWYTLVILITNNPRRCDASSGMAPRLTICACCALEFYSTVRQEGTSYRTAH
jgi:hypothetical protein